MSETKEALRQRIADLEAEVEKYKGLCAAYRASLGDVKANEIVIPELRRKFRPKPVERDQMEGWMGILRKGAK